MTSTTVAATYRARIADRGASTVSGNVALTLAISDLAGIPTLSGPSVDILGGSTTSHPFDLDCIVDSVLFTDSNRLAVIGRLIEIQRSTDGGSSWSTLATGRISGATEVDGRGKVTLSVSDERWLERATEMFGETDTMQLHPAGLASAFMSRPAAGTTTYDVVEVDGSAVKLLPTNIGGPTLGGHIPASLREALASDLVASEDRDNSATNTAGNFTDLRFRWTETNGSGITASDNTVIGFRQQLGGGLLGGTGITSLLGSMSPSGDGILNAAWVYLGAGHGLTTSDEVTGRFYWPNAITVNENVPLHIGGATGIHPFTLLKNILDGDYGGDAARYDSSTMTALEALSMPKVWVRATEPVDRAQWVEKNLYPVFGLLPTVGTDLALRPTMLRLPQDVSLGSLTTLDASEVSDLTWEHRSRDVVTVLGFSSQVLRVLDLTTDRGADWPADQLEPRRQKIKDIEHDNVSTLGRVAREVKTDLILSKSDQSFSLGDDTSRLLARDLFDVVGDGPSGGVLTLPDSTSVEVGDLVVLDHDTLKGFNPGTGDRTGDRIVRIIEFRERAPASITFGYLELGPASAALSAPTVSIAQDGTDPDLVNVTISGLSAGETAVVEVTAAASTPTEYDLRRSGVGNSTVSFRIDSGSGNAYARAYAFAPNRIRSAWATDNVALSSRPLIDDAGVTRTLYTATVSWEVNSGTAGMRTDYDVHNRNTVPTFGSNQTDYDATDGGFTITGLSSTREAISVKLTPYSGFSGGSVSGTAGDPIVVEAIVQKIDGGIFLPRYSAPTGQVAFDGSGQVVVSAQADEEAANIYVTVGDGSSPSDPTAASNDGSISGRSGSVNTSVTISADNDAIVKIVAADAAGNMGTVTTVTQAAESRAKTLRVDSAAFQINDESNTDVFYFPKYVTPTGTTQRTLVGTLPLPVGITVTQVRARLYMTNSTDDATIFFYRVDEDLTTGVTTIGSDTVTGVTGHQWAEITSLTESVTSSRVYKVSVQLDNTSSSGDVRFGFVEVSYTTPHMGAIY